MILAEHDAQQAVKQAETAFPGFTDWKYSNEEKDEDPFGFARFALWGKYNPDDNRCFFITFDACKEKWRGHLTIGRHYYIWTSADFGDAYLVDTEPCETLEDAIITIKEETAKLFRVFSAI